MRLYVAGPMRDYPQFNFPLFDSVTEELRAQGHTILNPAEHDRAAYKGIEQWPGFANGDIALCPEFNFHDAMRWDLSKVIQCDGIVLLPNWEASSGARTERFTAEQTGRQVYLAKLDENGKNVMLVEDSPDVMAGPTVRRAA